VTVKSFAANVDAVQVGVMLTQGKNTAEVQAIISTAKVELC